MIRYFLLIIVLLAGSSSDKVFSQEITDELVSLDFWKAGSKLENIKHKTSHIYWKALLSLTANRGNARKQDSVLYQKAAKQKSLELHQDLWQITDALYHYYYKNDNPKLLQLLNNALYTAREKNDVNLQKLCLIPILEYYSKNYSLNSKHFNKYFDQLKSISNSIHDQAHLTILENLREGRSAEWDPALFYQTGLNNITFYESHSQQLSNGMKVQLEMNIASHYRVNEQLDSALYYYKKILKYPERPFFAEYKFISCLDIGAIEVLKKNIFSASKYFDSSLTYLSQNDSVKKIIDYYRFKSNYFYEPLEIYDSAYLFTEKAFLLKRKHGYAENSRRITELFEELNVAEKEKQLLEEQQKAKQSRNLLIGSLALLLLGATIAILLQKNTSKKRVLAEQQREIQRQKVETLLKEQELASIDAMIEGQEKERQRVANELHDDLGSLMATIKLYFENLKKEKSEAILIKTNDLLDEAYQKIRTMAHAKNSGVMASQGLLPAVEKLADNLSKTGDLDIQVNEYGMVDRLENSIELTIFRIIQELMTNIIRHAEATEVMIQFTQHENTLNIMVEDNGRGFDIQAMKPGKNGMGLSSIEKRIEHLEGSFTVDSIPKKGTSIIIDIPIT